MTDVAPESAPTPAADGNAKPYSVSELAFALKRTLDPRGVWGSDMLDLIEAAAQ